MRLILSVTVFLMSIFSCIPAGAADSPAAALEMLHHESRTRLAERWRDDQAVAPAIDLLVRCDQAFGIHPLILRLPQRGGVWQKAKIVSAPDDVLIDKIDTDALTLDINDGDVIGVKGHLVIGWTPRTFLERGGWALQYNRQDEPDAYMHRQEKLAMQTHPHRSTTTYQLHAEAAVEGHTLEIALRERDGAWQEATASTPQWNRANHVVETDGLRIGPKKTLEGKLELTVLADRWVPDDGKPRPITLLPEITISDTGAIDGTYKLSGSMGEREGILSGSVNRELHGSYRFVREQERNGRLQVTIEIPDMNQATMLAMESAEQTETPAILSSLRSALAYHLALRDYPRPVSDAYAALKAASAHGDETRHSGILLEWLSTTLEANPISAEVVDSNPRFGPYHGEDLLGVKDGRNLIPVRNADPAQPQRWQRCSAWQIIGPFGVDAFPEAPMPEIVPPMNYAADALGPAAIEASVLEWQEADAIYHPAVPPASEVLESDWDHNAAKRDGNPKHSITYATTTIDVAADGEYYVALRAASQSVQLWIDQRMVDYPLPNGIFNRHQPLILRLPLSAGQHDVMMRIANNFEQIRAELWFCTAGTTEQDRTTAQTATTPPPQQWSWRGENNMGLYPEAEPPMTWDQEKGLNVAWRTAVPSGRGGVTVAGNRAFTTADPAQLLAINLDDGKILWQVSADDSEDSVQTASTTPVTTADRVWGWFGTGHAVCVDHDGNQLWTVDTGLRASGIHLASPILVDDLMIIQGIDSEHEQVAILALDASTGEQRWRSLPGADAIDFIIMSPRNECRWYRDSRPGDGWGLAAMRLHNADQHLDVIITHDGALLDAGDGRLITRRMPMVDGNRAPALIDGNTAYFSTTPGHSATELWLEADGRIGYRLRWLTRRRTFSGGGIPLRHSSSWPMSPLMIDDLLHVHRQDYGHRPRHRVRPFGNGDIYDPASGRWLGHRFNLTEGSNPSLPMVQAGTWLFAGNSGQGCTMGFSKEYGELTVALPGRSLLHITSNRIDPTYAAPVAAGKMLLVRGNEHLTAFAVDGEDGLRKQWERIADEQMAFIPPRPLADAITVVKATPGDFHAQDSMSVVDILPGICFNAWLIAGPIPPDAEVETPQIHDVKSLPEIGGQLPGSEVEWQSLTPRDHKIMSTSFAPEFHWTTDRPRFDHRIDLMALMGGLPGPGTSLLMATVLSIPETITANLVTGAAGMPPGSVTAFLGGKAVPVDAPLHLEAGCHILLLRIDFGRLPPFVRSLVIKPHLALSSDQGDPVQAWYDLIAERRPIIERVAEIENNRDAERARQLLEMLDNRK